MPDITVNLGEISLFDAKAVQLALAQVVDNGYFANPERYAAIIKVKSQLQYRIALAERNTPSEAAARARLHATIDRMVAK